MGADAVPGVAVHYMREWRLPRYTRVNATTASRHGHFPSRPKIKYILEAFHLSENETFPWQPLGDHQGDATCLLAEDYSSKRGDKDIETRRAEANEATVR